MEKFMNNGTGVVINGFAEVVIGGQIYLELINTGDVKILVEKGRLGKLIYRTNFSREKFEDDEHFLNRIMARIKAWNKVRIEEKRPTYCLPIKQAKMAMGMD